VWQRNDHQNNINWKVWSKSFIVSLDIHFYSCFFKIWPRSTFWPTLKRIQKAFLTILSGFGLEFSICIGLGTDHKVATHNERWIKSNEIPRKNHSFTMFGVSQLLACLNLPQNFAKKTHRYLAIFSQNNQDHF